MTSQPHRELVEKEARAVLGTNVDGWLFKPNRNLAHLTRYEMANCMVGARFVLQELERLRLTSETVI